MSSCTVLFALLEITSSFSVMPVDMLSAGRNQRIARLPKLRHAVRSRRTIPCASSAKHPASSANDFVLQGYTEVAQNLLKTGYYDGIIASIQDARMNLGSFVMLDSPSGSGKTQAGVALKGLAQTQKNWKFAHLIWDTAVPSQDIYDSIVCGQEEEGISSGQFFYYAKEFANKHRNADISTIDVSTVWSELVMPIFEGFPNAMPLSNFFAKYRLTITSTWVLFIDEVPSEARQVQDMLIIREALRRLAQVVVVFAGTNAKTANVVSTRIGYGSSSVKETLRPWALLISRLPQFVVGSSILGQNDWAFMESYVANNPSPDARAVFAAISCSVQGGGNPRLINFAISAFLAESQSGRAFSFAGWQSLFSQAVTVNKFLARTWSGAHRAIVSQLNLLLEASCLAHLADLALGSHFAHRAVPNSSGSTTGQHAGMKDCAGWLYIAFDQDRVFGDTLQYIAGPRVFRGAGVCDWDRTVFNPVGKDPLMYIGTCREEGNFVVQGPVTSIKMLRSHEVVKGLWRKNSAGSVNFQNPQALAKTGAQLEVVGAVAMCNAAATTGKSTNMITIEEYFVNLLNELGVTYHAVDVQDMLSNDDMLSEVLVPRILVPGSSLPEELAGYVGYIVRQADLEEHDGKVMYLKSKRLNSMRYEIKDRKKVGTGDIASMVEKVTREAGSLGLLIVRHCNNYWDGSRTRGSIAKLRRKLKDSAVGKMYFISDKGQCESIDWKNSKEGRVLLIQVP